MLARAGAQTVEAVMALSKHHSHLRKPVDVGTRNRGAAVRRQEVAAQLVAQDDQDVSTWHLD